MNIGDEVYWARVFEVDDDIDVGVLKVRINKIECQQFEIQYKVMYMNEPEIRTVIKDRLYITEAKALASILNVLNSRLSNLI